MTHPDHDAARVVLSELDRRKRGIMPRPITLTTDELDAIAAALADPSPASWPEGAGVERYRHKKRDKTYAKVGEADLQCDQPISDYAVVIVYQAEHDGRLWVRPVREFEDGRFERLPDATLPKGAAPAVAGVTDVQRQSAVFAVADLIERDAGRGTLSQEELYEQAGEYADAALEAVWPTNHPPGPAQGSEGGER